ncbi:MAG TPA: response regulator transcription factor, partial [Anaeromyxobacteraceae bacterium]|nr:response regulator transcription factor [Anaeromyxobacteraceae bacterium]
MSATRILLVDDHEVVRRGIAQALRDAIPGVEFGEAGDSLEAVALVSSRPWDVVLLDLKLPGRGGLDVLAEVKRLAPRTPVLVVSGYSEEEFAVRCIRAGADGYVPKTTGAREIIAAVRKVLDGGKYVTAEVAERLASAAQAGFTAPSHDVLSARELQVLKLVALGRSLKEIATEMNLAERTIATYRVRLGRKLGLSSNVDIARYAM